MNFFEKEFNKILNEKYENKIIGREAYIDLTKDRMIKLQFASRIAHGKYDAIKLTLINKTSSVIDSVMLNFSDIFGKKKVDNPNYKDGIVPYIWEDDMEIDWYIYKPTEEDYLEIYDQINSYVRLNKKEVEFRLPQEFIDTMEKNKRMYADDLPESIFLFAELESLVDGAYQTHGEWVKLAYKINEDFCITLKEQVKEICDAFKQVNYKYGTNIAKYLYDERTIVLPNEIEACGEYLHMGGKIEHLEELANIGFFQNFYKVTEESKWEALKIMNSGGEASDALDALRDEEEQQTMQF